MSIADQINADMKEAMKAKDKKKLEALRSIRSAILLLNTEASGSEASDEDIIKAMMKMVKQRKDAAAIYKDQGREDLYEDEIAQAAVIENYLPKMMSEDEVRKVVQEKISAVGASSPADMGKVMGPIMGQLQGKADGKMISSIVKEELGKL